MTPSHSLPSSIVAGQPSWQLSTSTVKAYVTQSGGHLGPVSFELEGRTVTPYALAPWAEEETVADLPRILKVLRGDFFCLPFGGNDEPFQGEQHPPHGETANSNWHFESLQMNDSTRLHLSLETTIRSGRVDKMIELREGHTALYCRHVVSGMSGPMNLGHHAMLKFPEEPGSGLVSTSGFTFGQVFPGNFEVAAEGGYSLLKAGATFDALESVPTVNGEVADLSRYPARKGYEDLVMLQTDQSQPFGWTAVVFPAENYVWFSLKDPQVLRGTVFWMSNGGRHYEPWSGRHTSVMGLEEVTSYFHSGLSESAQPNSLTERGYKTCLELDPHQPMRVNTIMAVAAIPGGFDHVEEITAQEGKVTLKSRSGQQVTTSLDISFLELDDR
jgi:hypothetical protein